VTTSVSLLDWIMNLLRDPEARDAFRSNPDAYATAHGLDSVSAADLHDVLCVAADNQPAHSDDSDRLPPPRYHQHGESAPHYLNHYVNHYERIEKHDTNIDNSVHQNIDTHGGDFDQHIDNDPVVASGDHSIAAGDDIRDSTLTSGNGSVVGDDNRAATGDGNDTAFGSGDATRADLGHSDFGRGSALSLDGTADGRSTDNDTRTDVHSSGSGASSVNAAGSGGYADHHADQHESDDSRHTELHDDSRTDSHDNQNSHNDARLEDSHDYHAH
jgi:hypothetical protein